MALPATLRRFQIALADSDREVYEQLDLRVAQHPSESTRYCAARVIARALEHAEGVDFSKAGLADDAEPALLQRNLRGELQAWIEDGLLSADRLHKASKACKRVVVYTWKHAQLAAELADRPTPIHRADELELHALDPDYLDRVAKTLDRTNKWDLSRTGGAVYLTIGDVLFETEIT